MYPRIERYLSSREKKLNYFFRLEKSEYDERSQPCEFLHVFHPLFDAAFPGNGIP